MVRWFSPNAGCRGPSRGSHFCKSTFHFSFYWSISYLFHRFLSHVSNAQLVRAPRRKAACSRAGDTVISLLCQADFIASPANIICISLLCQADFITISFLIITPPGQYHCYFIALPGWFHCHFIVSPANIICISLLCQAYFITISFLIITSPGQYHCYFIALPGRFHCHFIVSPTNIICISLPCQADFITISFLIITSLGQYHYFPSPISLIFHCCTRPISLISVRVHPVSHWKSGHMTNFQK